MEDEWGAPSYVDGVLRWFMFHWMKQNIETSQDEEGINEGQHVEDVENGSTTIHGVVTLRDGVRVKAQFGELGDALVELRDAVARSDASEGQKLVLVADINSIESQLAKAHPNPVIVAAAWEEVGKAASLRGCAAAVEHVSNLIGSVLP